MSFRVMLTESYSSIDVVMKYYGDGSREGSHIPFNFFFIEQINNNSNANDYKTTIDYWMNNMPANRIPNWVVSAVILYLVVLSIMTESKNLGRKS